MKGEALDVLSPRWTLVQAKKHPGEEMGLGNSCTMHSPFGKERLFWKCCGTLAGFGGYGLESSVPSFPEAVAGHSG